MEQTKSPEGIAAHKILDFILHDEAIRNMGEAKIISTLRCIANSLENPGQEASKTNVPKVSKQAMKATREYIGSRIALALWVSPQEKKGLQAMGYDPDGLICIERFNDETVFLQARYAGPICLSKKDGGGRKDCRTPVAKNGLSIYEKEATRFMADLKKAR